MSDDLSKALKQIGEMLSQDKGKDSLMALLSLLSSSGSKESSNKESEIKENKIDEQKEEEEKAESFRGKDSPHESTEMMRQLASIMDKLNTRHDPRVRLLTSLKPFLSPSRQKKLNNCIMLLQLTSIVRSMDLFRESDHDGI
ncbi:MAG TPA: hypothetical protein GXX37_12685 [Clostridiaceae bacterium]|nr:hypothetical protein [Clostridiaceae bacterium]